MNLLKNGGFEGEAWHRTHTGVEIGEVSAPKHWIAFWKDGEPNERSGDVDCRRPECKVISKQPPFLDPPRIHGGNQAFQCFTFFGVHDAGIYQRVEGLTPGARVRATAWTHAWSSDGDDAHQSDLDGGAQWNFEQFVGVDPNGGTDPWSDSVVWSEPRNVYDEYEQLPPVEAEVGDAGAVTVFLRSTVQYPFKHCDAHWDDAVLKIVGDTPDEPGPAECKAGKIGPHVIRNTPTVQPWIEARPAVLKLAGDWEIAADVPPQTLVIGRKVMDEIPGMFSDPPEQVAAWLVEQQREVYEAHPYIGYWEGPNEKDVGTPEQMRWLSEMEAERVRLLDEMGLQAVIFNFSTGQPALSLWEHAVPALDAIDEHGGLIGLHEYTSPIMQALTNDLQPDGGDALLNAGWLTLRYRLVHEHLAQMGFEHLQMVITECGLDTIGESLLIDPDASNGPWREHAAYWANVYGRADAARFYGEQLLWYESELRKDDYVIGATVFTEGAYADFAEFDVAGTEVVDMLTSIEDDEQEVPDERGKPRHQYARVYHVIPGDTPTSEATAIFRSIWDENPSTIGPSYDDAGIGDLDDRIAILHGVSEEMRDEFLAFYAEHYPGVDVFFEDMPKDPEEPEGLQMVDIRDELPTNQDSPWYPWPQRDLDEITTVFVHHSAGVQTSDVGYVHNIALYHTGATGKNRPGICYTYVIGDDGTVWYVSSIENAVFSQGSAEHPGDENRWGLGVCLLGSFIDGREPSVAQIAALEQLIAHVEDQVGHALRVWGHKDVIDTQCPGDSWPFRPGWGKEVEPSTPPGASTTLIGFNDEDIDDLGTGAGWMMRQGLRGLIVRPVYVGTSPGELDFSAEAAAGLRVIVNLRYSWSTDAGGQGTLPAPDSPIWYEFINAAQSTILRSRGVWAWTISNEANNPREHPHGGELFPGDVRDAYMDIRHGLDDVQDLRMAPGALDPFNAERGDPRDWLRQVWYRIPAEFAAFHGYIRGADPNLVGSELRFADHPLTWQYLNYPGCVLTMRDALPGAYQDLDVYVTEFNHLWKTSEGDWGWVHGDAAIDVIHAAYWAAREHEFAGLAIYRWAGDAWAVHDNEAVKAAVQVVESL